MFNAKVMPENETQVLESRTDSKDLGANQNLASIALGRICFGIVISGVEFAERDFGGADGVVARPLKKTEEKTAKLPSSLPLADFPNVL
jgi:hypothetical protein